MHECPAHEEHTNEINARKRIDESRSNTSVVYTSSIGILPFDGKMAIQGLDGDLNNYV
jgi:hypothetical protein